MTTKFPFFRQIGELDCGIACLRMITKFFGRDITLSQLQTLIREQENGVSMHDLSETANSLGLNSLGVKIDYDRLADDIPTPCIAFWKQQHFIVVYHVTERFVWVADPASKGLFITSRSAFEKGWIFDPELQEGIVLLLETTSTFYEKAKRATRTLSSSS